MIIISDIKSTYLKGSPKSLEEEGEHKEYREYREEQIEHEDNIPQASRKKLNLNNSLVITGMLEKVIVNLYNAMKLYWNNEKSETLILALLDPQIKSFKFIDEEIRNKTKKLLKIKYNELKINTSSTNNTTIIITTSEPSIFLIFE
ncbi:4612_t:CDS:2 [Funneliformis caledonium]|uniref:4612_t:CDS:1 n=1 Tax=Funneliformis caledonium TaxID=1117310 RepID=A0A9N9ASN8_9GLOM|nr:4612_t:CDS:2 [Funneliformis caledonium]